MPVADTSFLVGLLDQKDPHHDKALHAFREGSGLWIPLTAAVETLYVLTRRSDRKAALASLRSLLDHPWVQCQDAAQVDAAFDIVTRHRRLSWADAHIVAHARARDGILTFDEAQRKAC